MCIVPRIDEFYELTNLNVHIQLSTPKFVKFVNSYNSWYDTRNLLSIHQRFQPKHRVQNPLPHINIIEHSIDQI